MSKWDWIHAGLEVATYATTRNAQRNLAEMKSAAEMEAARRALLDAMRGFVFDISRDIQLAEEQIPSSPQQVYIVSRSLEWRLLDSGLSADLFPDFADKEYTFKTQKKIAEVVGQSRARLTTEQIEESDLAVRYIAEMPLLNKAIPAKKAQESLGTTDAEWQRLNAGNRGTKWLMYLGLVGLAMTMCVAIPLLISGMGMLNDGGLAPIGKGLMMSGIGLAIPVGSIALTIVGSRTKPEFASLKASRDGWQKQLVSGEDWQQVISAFGDLTSEELQSAYDERQAFLAPLLGSDSAEYLTAAS